jgi:hypothetical protein
MACQLQRIKKRTYRAPIGASVTMCFSNAGGTVKLTSAEFEVGQPLAIDHDSCVTFQVKSGTESLFTVVTSPNPNDTYQVSENCGGGNTQKLEDEDYDPNDDAKVYRILGV